MEEQGTDQDGGQPPLIEGDINSAVLPVINRDIPGRSNNRERCARGCSRAAHCVLALPFLAIVALTIVSIACFSGVQNQVGGCVLFGSIRIKEGEFQRGRDAECYAVFGGEAALCVVASFCTVALIIKAFLGSKL